MMAFFPSLVHLWLLIALSAKAVALFRLHFASEYGQEIQGSAHRLWQWLPVVPAAWIALAIWQHGSAGADIAAAFGVWMAAWWLCGRLLERQSDPSGLLTLLLLTGIHI